jgi:hypothetical protein
MSPVLRLTPVEARLPNTQAGMQAEGADCRKQMGLVRK